MTTERFELAFSFKGNRSYIQGPDMLDAVTEVLRKKFATPVGNLDFQIHRMAASNLVLELTPSEQVAEAGDAVATLHMEAGGAAWQGRLLEVEGTPEGRRPYDEDRLVAACDFIDETGVKAITVPLAEDYTNIEAFVSMNKALHLRTFPGVRKWVFCRWSSEAWPLDEPARDIRVTLGRSLGTRLTRSTVTVRGKAVGTVYFSAMEEGQ